MAQTLYNGARVPTNSDPYKLTEDLKKLCLSLNIPISVASKAERDGLDDIAGTPLNVGQMVIREDQSMFVEKWDGNAWKTSGHSEWSRSDQGVPSGQVWGAGPLSLDAGKSTDTAFITHPANDLLRFRDTGNYAVTFTAVSSAALTGRSFIEIAVEGSPLIRAVMTGEDRGAAVIPNYRATAGEDMAFGVYHSSGSTRVIDYRVRVTRIG
jgi:hypothetical protein